MLEKCLTLWEVGLMMALNSYIRIVAKKKKNSYIRKKNYNNFCSTGKEYNQLDGCELRN